MAGQVTPLSPAAPVWSSNPVSAINMVQTVVVSDHASLRDDLLAEDVGEVADNIVRLPEIPIRVCGQNIEALLDTGSEITCVSQPFWDTLISTHPDLPRLPSPTVMVTGAFNGKSQSVTEQTYLPVVIDHVVHEIPMLIVPCLHRKLIIGSDWLQCRNAVLDFKSKVLCISFAGETQTISFSMSTLVMEYTSCHPLSMENTKMEKSCSLIGQLNSVEGDDAQVFAQRVNETVKSLDVTPSQRNKISQLLLTHASAFSDKPGKVNNYVHEIEMTNTTPFSQKSYPIPYSKRSAVDEQIQQMLEWGVIEPAPSAYTNTCLDARLLNSRLAPQSDTPMPIKELLQTLTGSSNYLHDTRQTADPQLGALIREVQAQ